MAGPAPAGTMRTPRLVTTRRPRVRLWNGSRLIRVRLWFIIPLEFKFRLIIPIFIVELQKFIFIELFIILVLELIIIFLLLVIELIFRPGRQ